MSGEGGGTAQRLERQVDNGRSGMGTNTRPSGSANKDYSNTQTEAPRYGKESGVGGGDKVEGSRYGEGSRTYRQEVQKGSGPIQATLGDMWKGKGKDTMRPWSEDVELRLRELEIGQDSRQRSESFYA